MAVETVVPRSRRLFLAGSLGGLAALAAQALGRPSPARAADPNDVVLGATNSATAMTKIENTTNDYDVLRASSSGGGTAFYGDSNSGDGVWVSSNSGYGVYGQSGSNVGVGGTCDSGYGVMGRSTLDIGVYGDSGATDRAATVGKSKANATGLLGYSGAVADSLPAAPAKTGVYGYAAQDGSARGVTGETTAGRGVNGLATTGTAVYGESDGGYGVYASSGSSIGVYGYSGSGVGVWGGSGSDIAVYGDSGATDRAATVGKSKANATGLLGYSGGSLDDLPAAPARTGVYGYAAQDSSSRGVTGQSTAGRGVNGLATSGRGVHGYASTGIGVYATAGATGTALQASGRIRFSTAGLATIGAGTSSAVVTPGVDLTSSSKILCTLEGNPGAGVTVHRLVKNTAADTFTVYLTGAAANNVKVAWFVIG